MTDIRSLYGVIRSLYGDKKIDVFRIRVYFEQKILIFGYFRIPIFVDLKRSIISKSGWLG